MRYVVVATKKGEDKPSKVLITDCKHLDLEKLEGKWIYEVIDKIEKGDKVSEILYQEEMKIDKDVYDFDVFMNKMRKANKSSFEKLNKEIDKEHRKNIK